MITNPLNHRRVRIVDVTSLPQVTVQYLDDYSKEEVLAEDLTATDGRPEILTAISRAKIVRRIRGEDSDNGKANA